MCSKSSFAIILITMLLADSIISFRWQGTGSGMNNTVLAEIWLRLESNLDSAITTNTQAAFNALTQQISDRLNNKWDKAWNVVLVITQPNYDSILYGYAFRNQWMWFNGVPNTVYGSTKLVALLVWKDYNCKDWKNILSTEFGTFDQGQMNALLSVTNTLTDNQVLQDIWGTARKIMNSLMNSGNFPGAYTMVMTSQGIPDIYGTVCRVQDSFANIMSFSPGSYGGFYIFQTRT